MDSCDWPLKLLLLDEGIDGNTYIYLTLSVLLLLSFQHNASNKM